MIESTVDLTVRQGETACLRLERQGVGGYLWSIGDMPPGARLLGEPEQRQGSDVGEGTELAVRIAADRPGRYAFACELRRPWGARELAERRVVTIIAS